MTQVVPLEIESIAAGGDGVARKNGLVVFVPRTAPGDLVTARISGKGTFARGALRSITRPSTDRVDPPCEHYIRDRCGGCQLQHIAYDAQLAAKTRIIRDALERIGKRGVALPEIVSSPIEWRYRTKLTLAIRRNARGGWIAGLHPYDDPSRVFALADCPITDRRIVAIWRDILAHADLFPDSPSLRGSVRVWSDGARFVLMGGARFTRAKEMFDAVSSLTVMWWEDDSESRRLIGDRRREDRGSPVASFAQVNPHVASLLQRFVIDLIVKRSPASLIDAYSGAGDLAMEIASRGVRVTAIEVDPDASAWCAAKLPEGSTAVAARVEDAIASQLPADVVVINPPRAGVDEKVCATLESQSVRPRSIIYVSCNPATLARDLARLPSYRIESVTAFDMFPQTAHVESVCELVPS